MLFRSADFTIWLISILAWVDAVIPDSYFASRACALVDSDTTAIGLLPAGVVLFLIPKRLKVCINIILSLGLLCFLLWSWLGSSLLWLIVVNWFMVYWFVMDWLVMDWFMVSIEVLIFVVLS